MAATRDLPVCPMRVRSQTVVYHKDLSLHLCRRRGSAPRGRWRLLPARSKRSTRWKLRCWQLGFHASGVSARASGGIVAAVGTGELTSITLMPCEMYFAHSPRSLRKKVSGKPAATDNVIHKVQESRRPLQSYCHGRLLICVSSTTQLHHTTGTGR